MPNIRYTGAGCWEWMGHRDAKGYGEISLGGKRYKAHRLFALLFHGEFDDLLYVCHRCDNPPCVNPMHLFIGTQKDNIQDAISKGRFKGRPSLSAEERSYITGILAHLLARYKTQSELARQIGITRQAVHMWFTGQSWPTHHAKRRLAALIARPD